MSENEKLGQMNLDTFMEKLGAGGHKPGAGSAAAIEGMISAKLIITVIELSKDKDQYKEVIAGLEKIEETIENTIYPRLHDLMQKDAEAFDKVIKLREARDEEEDIQKKCKLAALALEAQVPATEIPLEIAQYCLTLANYAMTVFDSGFKSARGDSSVAINIAVSAVAGCLSIIDLNLLSFRTNEWTEKMRNEAEVVKTEYTALIEKASEKQEALNKEAEVTRALHIELNSLQAGIKNNTRFTNPIIERIATKLQKIMWKYREVIWKNNIPKTPYEILNSKMALGKLGYQFQVKPNLNHFSDGTSEVAGVIDSKEMFVTISGQFSKEVKSFTTAHELGHALMHPNQVLHRDIPLDGSVLSGYRDQKEIDADKFASYFLMPKEGIEKKFQERFHAYKFVIGTDTAVSMGLRLADLRKQCKNLRDLSILVAKTNFYQGNNFSSLAEQFGVSIEAMSIRLEELDLVRLYPD